ncbi:HDOD domain-containing protein [Geothrix sp. PMB-07]|uniref:HDOD domain-containing protein n=1 Tax=Geothrix sp. PMB-07 TaxID=3068640 RepID=UPI0027403C2A|nr:HDOD domain-containing protein [Geothrix sp. PMB-07]WLT32628.1 HDOD domain-containing protein [Geothrix sp. PMB-07]
MITREQFTSRLKAKTLPSLPLTVVALGEAVQDERCTVDRVLGILSKDPSLSATLLRLANSALYATEGAAMDLRTAVLRLGFDAVANLGTGAAVIRTLKGGTHLDAVKLWQHSVAVGLTAKGVCVLARRHGQAETAFLTGLLHDIGKIALDTCFPEAYSEVLQAVADGTYFVDAERALLGMDHAEAGALLAAEWSFPQVIVDVIRDHHDPRPDDFLSNLTHLSDLLVRTRIPMGPADERLLISLDDLPAFKAVMAGALQKDLDVERLTFSIDDEVDHALAFVEVAFQA